MAVDTLVTGSKLTAIADAIRKIAGSESTYTLDEMPDAIAKGGGGGSFDWSAVTNMEYMFQNSAASSVDLSSVSDFTGTKFDYMFQYSKASVISGLGNLNAASAHSVRPTAPYMFGNASYLQGIDFTGATWTDDISGWGGINLNNFATFCVSLKSLKLPTMTSSGVFLYMQDFASYCSNLESADFNVFTSTSDSAVTAQIREAFYGCSKLTHAIMPAVDTFDPGTHGSYAPFKDCYKLEYIEIQTPPHDAIVTLSSGTLFGDSGVINSNTKIVVPDDVVADYKAATNWSLFADHIVGKSEYFG